jgi:linoleoyl-CoA desaturase
MELDGLAALRAEFTARGWNRKAPLAVLGELLVHVVLGVSGYAAFLLGDEAWIRWGGMAICVYGSLGVATNTHTSTHYGTSDKRWVNDLFSFFGYPFFLGLGLTYWRNSHIVLHHTSPNVMGVDPDAAFMPLFATTDAEVASVSGWRRRYFERHQLSILLAVLWLHTFKRQARSIVYAVKALMDPERRRVDHGIDLMCMALYWVAWVIVPSFFLSPSELLWANFVRIFGIAYPLFAILAPAHYPEEAGCVRKGEWKKDFLALQTISTINYRTGPVGGFICSGLQYQIEHHLFPSYSHVYYPKMAPLVQAFCERHGYPYRTLGWLESLLKVFLVFARPKHEAADLGELRREFGVGQVDGDRSAAE